MSKPKTVRLYPAPDAFLHPWPAVAFDATPEEAEFLLGHHPPPFTTEPPGTAPDPQPTGPADAGPSDSTEA